MACARDEEGAAMTHMELRRVLLVGMMKSGLEGVEERRGVEREEERKWGGAGEALRA